MHYFRDANGKQYAVTYSAGVRQILELKSLPFKPPKPKVDWASDPQYGLAPKTETVPPAGPQ